MSDFWTGVGAVVLLLALIVMSSVTIGLAIRLVGWAAG